MKRYPISLKIILIAILFLLLLLAVFSSKAQGLKHYDLIAHYPLTQNLSDATGNHNDLQNANWNFSRGGICSNGKYFYSDTTGTLLESPNIDSLRIESFAFALEFLVDSAPGFRDPIIFMGNAWRSLGIYVNTDSTLNFAYNDHIGIKGNQKIKINQWQEVIITYNTVTQIGCLFLDSMKIATDTFILNHGNDWDFMNYNGGAGTAFRGYWRNLKIFNYKFNVGLKNLEYDSKSMILYPNPSAGNVFIELDFELKNENQLKIYSLEGKIIHQEKIKNKQDLILNLNHLKKGIYFLEFQNGTKKFVRKLILN